MVMKKVNFTTGLLIILSLVVCILVVLVVNLHTKISAVNEKIVVLQDDGKERLDILWADFYMQNIEVPESLEFAGKIMKLDEITREELWNRMMRFMSERWRWPILNYRLKKYAFVLDTLIALEAPEDLKYVAIQESFLNPRAVSFASAKGFWQFITRTGRVFGLQIDSYVDERLDPAKSTIAAVKFFNYLFEIFDGDWALSAAGYNSGEANILKNIKIQGTKNYFGLQLNKETSDYFLSILTWKLINDREDGFVRRFKPKVDYSIPSVEVRIILGKPLLAKTILPVFENSYHMWRSLNPMYIKDVVPTGRHLIRIPLRHKDLFQKIIMTQNLLYVKIVEEQPKNLGG